jgi:hypothetical protein
VGVVLGGQQEWSDLRPQRVLDWVLEQKRIALVLKSAELVGQCRPLRD